MKVILFKVVVPLPAIPHDNHPGRSQQRMRRINISVVPFSTVNKKVHLLPLRIHCPSTIWLELYFLFAKLGLVGTLNLIWAHCMVHCGVSCGRSYWMLLQLLMYYYAFETFLRQNHPGKLPSKLYINFKWMPSHLWYFITYFILVQIKKTKIV